MSYIDNEPDELSRETKKHILSSEEKIREQLAKVVASTDGNLIHSASDFVTWAWNNKHLFVIPEEH
ncbi:unnamed protein product [Commensalibacter communis]|uniref:Uncharacterized protein n=1 Tax=Commensalibacter communis TaxID=2972786 RepID=A0A9W4X7J6_9PROT|nr:hypothetical protein [Commensalibacter communis]CAI3953902.1 unnamed protein product [Commensalibacter communis]CAI3956281.1 unnamed protein product [Commensalibacter communis]CAI3956674.1 unnamed protein product [Commensalibacter communis]CAI3956995.1 unnamed protein product [Commensalibacter communis]